MFTDLDIKRNRQSYTQFPHLFYSYSLLKSWSQWLQRLLQACSKTKEQWTLITYMRKKRAEGFVNILKYLLLFFFLLTVYFPLIKYWTPWDKQSAYFNAWKSYSTLCRLRQINTKSHYGKMSPAIAFCLPVLVLEECVSFIFIFCICLYKCWRTQPYVCPTKDQTCYKGNRLIF